MILLAIFAAKIILAAVLTVAGSLWIDKLYSRSTELTFPEEISSRARFRKPILFVAFAFFSLFGDLWTMAAIFLLVLMTVTDFEQYMLFDAMTLPLALLGGFYVWQMNLNFQAHIAAALIGGGIFLLLSVLSKGSLGGGDVKLIAALGLWLGAQKLISVVLIGTIIGGLVAVLMILTNQKDRSSYFAYGPYFALTAIYFLLKP
ncbi:MAG: prepilin peptidase [Selenomonadaceae bacterium]|nr:prepilin peptidase [Selenomonadaceae bacterium]